MDIKEEYAKKILDYLVMEGKLTEEDLKKVKSAIPSPLVEDAMRIIHALCCIRQMTLPTIHLFRTVIFMLQEVRLRQFG
jgi:hypothetical protein